MDILYKSGFAFFKDHGDGVVEFENKFTGLRVVYDTKTGKRTVREVL